jgi:hypothetical protein
MRFPRIKSCVRLNVPFFIVGWIVAMMCLGEPATRLALIHQCSSLPFMRTLDAVTPSASVILP